MLKGLYKKGQQVMGMSFGMIFAIFLIVVFVVMAFIAVNYFLDIGDTAGTGMFYDELQKEVNNAQRGQYADSVFKVNLPSGIKTICFANLSNEITNPGTDYEQIRYFELRDANTFLLPPESAKNMESKYIEHIDIDKITENQNPYCVDAFAGLKIKKDFYDKLVVIE